MNTPVERFEAGAKKVAAARLASEREHRLVHGLIADTLIDLRKRVTNAYCESALAFYIDQHREAASEKPYFKTSAEWQTAGLTPRHAELLRLIMDGLMNKEIAHRMGNAVKTVEKLRNELYVRLGVSTVSDLAKFYYFGTVRKHNVVENRKAA